MDIRIYLRLANEFVSKTKSDGILNRLLPIRLSFKCVRVFLHSRAINSTYIHTRICKLQEKQVELE